MAKAISSEFDHIFCNWKVIAYNIMLKAPSQEKRKSDPYGVKL